MTNDKRHSVTDKGLGAVKQQWLLLGLLFIICNLSFTRVAAQDDPEYRMEIGGGAGVMSYLGDFNGSLLKNMQPIVGAVAKFKLNPRMDWAANIGYGKLKGGSKDAKTWYPELTEHPIEFSSSVIDVTVCFEYNFWPFGTGREYLGARPLTPYIAIGAGFTIAKPDIGDQAGGIQFPVGAGVKYKLKDRLNLVAEWMMHFTASDKLDGVEDPYGIKSTGLFKNTDCYSMLRLTLTYDFWARCKTCHNDRD